MRPKTPPEYVEAYVNASVVKANLPGYKLLILGNMVAGMFLISLPLYILHKDVIFRDPTHREYLKTEKQNAAQGQEKHKV